MKVLLLWFNKFLNFLSLLEKVMGAVLLTTIVISIFIQVFSRYVLNRPHIWVEELATYCFIWLVFVGASYSHIKGRHIIVTTLVDCFYLPFKRFLRILSNISIIIFLSFALYYGYRQFIIEAPQFTIALPVKLPRRIFYSAPFLFSVTSMQIVTIRDLLHSIQNLLSPPSDGECEEVDS